MRKTATRIAEVCLFLITTFLLAYSLTSIPYYSAWDMDLISAIDLLEIQNGNLPLHINHTGLGLYLTSHFFLKISQVFQFLSIRSYSELLDSWNVLLSIAEFTSWFKFLNIIPFMGIISFSYLGIKNYLKDASEYTKIIALLSLISISSLWNFHIFHVRSELYSLLFFSLTFYFLSTIQKPDIRKLLIFGFLAGLSFITKFQGFFVLVLFILMLSWDEKSDFFILSKKWKISLLLGFVGISVLSRMTYLPSHFAEFARGYFPNLFFFVIAGIAVLSLYVKPGRMIKNFVFPAWSVSMVNRWAVISTGILLPFFLAFLFYADFSRGFEYLLFLWRMIFLKLGRTDTYVLRHASKLDMYLWTFNYFWPYLLALGLVILKSKKNIKLGLLVLVTIGSLLLVHRGDDQDAIWNELTLIWFFYYLARDLDKKWVTIGSLLFVIGNVKNFHNIGFLTNKHRGHMKITRFLREPYENPFMGYTELINKQYPHNLQMLSLKMAKNHKSLRSEQEILWAMPGLKINRLNLVQPNAKIGKEIFIQNFSQPFENKLISGFENGFTDVQINLEQINDYYILTSSEKVDGQGCLVTETDLFLETSKPARLRAFKVVPTDSSPWRDVKSCSLTIDKDNSLYIIQG